MKYIWRILLFGSWNNPSLINFQDWSQTICVTICYDGDNDNNEDVIIIITIVCEFDYNSTPKKAYHHTYKSIIRQTTYISPFKPLSKQIYSNVQMMMMTNMYTHIASHIIWMESNRIMMIFMLLFDLIICKTYTNSSRHSMIIWISALESCYLDENLL